MPQLTPFLMFQGQAKQAIDFYLAAIPNSSIESLQHLDGASADKVMHAVLMLAGQRVMVIDSPAPHGFTFTPAMSLHVMSDSADQVDAIVQKLSAGGQFLMPLCEYPFSKRYAWFNDRFGVSWQVMLRTF